MEVGRKEGDRLITLPMPPLGCSQDYEAWIKDTDAVREYLTEMIRRSPDLFPQGIQYGWAFHGWTKNKQGTRRIRLKLSREVFQLVPESDSPYGDAPLELVQQGVALRRYGVPFQLIAEVLGRSPAFWSRAISTATRPANLSKLNENGYFRQYR